MDCTADVLGMDIQLPVWMFLAMLSFSGDIAEVAGYGGSPVNDLTWLCSGEETTQEVIFGCKYGVFILFLLQRYFAIRMTVH